MLSGLSRLIGSPPWTWYEMPDIMQWAFGSSAYDLVALSADWESPTPQMACSESAGGRSVASITARIIEFIACASPSCAVPGPRMTV